MNATKVVKSIETIINGLEDLKNEFLVSNEPSETATDVSPKAKKASKKSEDSDAAIKPVDTTSKKSAKKSKKSADTNDEDYASMKYNDLKKLAVERGMKSPNVSKDEIIAFLNGESVDTDEDIVENEAVENETDEEDLTSKVTELLDGVETEDIAGFLAENGISAKGKRPSLIAKIVSAIEDGDLSLDDLEVEEEEEDVVEEEPKPKKSEKPKKKAKKPEPEPEIEEDEDDSEEDFYGYIYDSETEMYVNEDEENELLTDVTPDRFNAFKDYMATVEKDVKKKAKKSALVEEVEDFFGDGFNADEDDVVEFAGIKFLLMTDDDGETHDFEDPYEINGIAVCCGQALTETEDGYLCEICENEYE